MCVHLAEKKLFLACILLIKFYVDKEKTANFILVCYALHNEVKITQRGKLFHFFDIAYG